MPETIEALLARRRRSSPGSTPTSSSRCSPAAARTCASTADELLFREGEPADAFYLVRHGQRRARDPRAGPGPIDDRDPRGGEVLGWSWLFPPYRWHFDARALEAVRADGARRRLPARQVRADPTLGYELMKRFAQVLIERLQATRLQLLDVYGRRDAHRCRAGGPTLPGRTGSRAAAGDRRHLHARARALDGAPGSRSRRASSTCSTPSASARCRSRSAATRARRTARAHDARRRRRHRRALRSSRRAPSSACAGRSAPPGRSTAARGRDVVVVAGGIGLAPLRPAIYQRARRTASDYGRVAVLYGAPHARPTCSIADELRALAWPLRPRRRRHRRPGDARLARRASAWSPKLIAGRRLRSGTAPSPSSAAPRS